MHFSSQVEGIRIRDSEYGDKRRRRHKRRRKIPKTLFPISTFTHDLDPTEIVLTPLPSSNYPTRDTDAEEEVIYKTPSLKELDLDKVSTLRESNSNLNHTTRNYYDRDYEDKSAVEIYYQEEVSSVSAISRSPRLTKIIPPPKSPGRLDLSSIEESYRRSKKSSILRSPQERDAYTSRSSFKRSSYASRSPAMQENSVSYASPVKARTSRTRKTYTPSNIWEKKLREAGLEYPLSKILAKSYKKKSSGKVNRQMLRKKYGREASKSRSRSRTIDTSYLERSSERGGRDRINKKRSTNHDTNTRPFILEDQPPVSNLDFSFDNSTIRTKDFDSDLREISRREYSGRNNRDKDRPIYIPKIDIKYANPKEFTSPTYGTEQNFMSKSIMSTYTDGLNVFKDRNIEKSFDEGMRRNTDGRQLRGDNPFRTSRDRDEGRYKIISSRRKNFDGSLLGF